MASGAACSSTIVMETSPSTAQTRVVVYSCVTDIPGSREARPNTLGNIFCKQVLQRELKTRVRLSGFDCVHYLPGFDSDHDIQRWFLYDLNVVTPLDKQEVLSIPHMVFLARRSGDKWEFIPRDNWIEQAKMRCSTYKWGGNTEQEIISEMRQENLNIE